MGVGGGVQETRVELREARCVVSVGVGVGVCGGGGNRGWG